MVRMRAALDVHKRSIVCASQPDDPRAGELRVQEIPNTERAIRGLVRRLGGPEGLVVCYEGGPCGYDPYRLFTASGVACDIVAPALIPRAPGARVKTDRRDAKRLLVLHRAGALKFVYPPTPAQEGLRDLVRCRDDLVCARRAARHRVVKQLLRYGHIYREGKKGWTKRHIASVRRQRLRHATPPGCPASGSTTRSRRRRWSTCSPIWTASPRRSLRSITNSTRSPRASH